MKHTYYREKHRSFLVGSKESGLELNAELLGHVPRSECRMKSQFKD